MSHASSPLKNTLWLGGERLLRAALSAAILGIVARHLEPAGFAQLSFALGVVIIAGSLAVFGLEGLVVNELVRQPDRAGAILGTALRLRLLAGLVTMVLIWLGTASASVPHDAAALIHLVAFTLLFQPAEVVDLWFQRHLASRRTAVLRLGVTLVSGATKLALVAGGYGATAFACAQVGEAALYAVGFGWSYARGSQRTTQWCWSPDIARLFWRRGLPLALAGLVVMLSLKFDQMLVFTLLPACDAGTYFAAARLCEIAFFAGGAVTTSLLPGLAAAHEQSPEFFRTRLQTVFDAVTALGWVVAVAFATVGPALLALLFGADYAKSAPLLVVQGFACVFALNAGARWQYILLAAPTTLNLVCALFSIATQFGLSLWLAPSLGSFGIALAWAVSFVVSGYLTTFLFRALRPCAAAQSRALLIPFSPWRWRAMRAAFTA